MPLIQLKDDAIINILDASEGYWTSMYCPTCGPDYVSPYILFETENSGEVEASFCDDISIAAFINHILNNLDGFAAMTTEEFVEHIESLYYDYNTFKIELKKF
jgi:hypothetical protein